MSAYVMTIRVNTRSDEGMEEYLRIALTAPLNGLEVIADSRSGQFEVLEGPARETAVIMRFDSVEAARAWYFSDQYQAAVKERWKSGEFQSFLVEGTD